METDSENITLEERRANLTDELFEEMSSNPRLLLPFLVNWDQVFLAPV